MNLLINLCLALFVLVSLLMVLVILMQRPKSEGLGAAFGGAVTENIFGAQTTNVLVKFTTWLAGVFFALTLGLSILYAHRSTADSAFRRELMKTQAVPQNSPAPAAAQPSPVSSPMTTPVQASPGASAAPNSGAGVLPAGAATPATSPASTAPPPAKPSYGLSPKRPPIAADQLDFTSTVESRLAYSCH
jgi:preprotein translocase subunit SecG